MSGLETGGCHPTGSAGQVRRLRVFSLFLGLAFAWGGLLPAGGRAAGTGWTQAVCVATGAVYPASALDGKGNAHLVWVDADGGALRHLILGQGERTIPTKGCPNYYPSLAADDEGRVHATWDDGYNQYYAVWDGTSWSRPYPENRLGLVGAGYEGGITLDELGRPHVLFWSSDGGGGFGSYTPYYTALIDGQWSTPRRLPSFIPSNNRLSFQVHGSVIHVSFLCERPGGVLSVGYTTSVDGGLSWGALEDVAGPRAPVYNMQPPLVLEGQVVVVAWMSQDPQTQILRSWYSRRVDGHWTEPAPLVEGGSGQWRLAMAWDGVRLFTAFEQPDENMARQIGVASTDPASGQPGMPLVFGWSGSPQTLVADARLDGEAIVVWQANWREVYYSYRPPCRPSSAVTSLAPTTVSSTFLVRWKGVDRSGTGIASYDVQVRDGDGPWTDWQVRTTATSALYTQGECGHTYRFRSRAVDNAGQVEAWHLSSDAATTVVLTGLRQAYVPLTIRQR